MSDLKIDEIKTLTPEQIEYVQKLYKLAYTHCFQWTNQDKFKDSKEIKEDDRN